MGQNNPYIHTVQDTTDKIDFTHAQEVTRVSLGYAVELGLVDPSYVEGRAAAAAAAAVAEQ